MAAPYRYQHGDQPLEGYTILRGIGRGGFGEVYYAISDGGREVALKVIQQNHDIELRGVRQCINLKSPHLVSIFDIKRNADGNPFVIMEYVAGPSLRDFVPKGESTLGVEKAVFLVQEISKGLGYLHERGIVHRDLKPENIFYEDGYVKIGDYGLSKYISVSRQSGQTISVGTVHYMAPEIGSGNYHQSIDVYALGVIFYELLTGTVPFNGDSMGEILMKHLTNEPDVSILPPLLRPVVKKALQKDPAKRYQSTTELVADALASGDLAEGVARIDPQSITSFTGQTSPKVKPIAKANPTLVPPAGPRATGPVVEPPPVDSPSQETTTILTGKGDIWPQKVKVTVGAALVLLPIFYSIIYVATTITRTLKDRGRPVPFVAEVLAHLNPSAHLNPTWFIVLWWVLLIIYFFIKWWEGATSTEGFFAKEVDRRLVPGIATAAAMAFAIGLLTRNSGVAAVGGYLVVIVIVASSILVVQKWFIPRFDVRSDTLRRLVTLGLVGPVLAGTLAALAAASVGLLPMAKSIPALLAGLLCVDWNRRVRPDRPEQVSLRSALLAGLFGLVAAAVVKGNIPLAFGLLAALSLVLNTMTSHTPLAKEAPHGAPGMERYRKPSKRRSPREYGSP